MRIGRRPGSASWVALAAGLLLPGVAAARDSRTNLIELHRNSGKLTNNQCLACHASILKATTSDRKFKTFHRVHLESRLATPKDCSACHESVDLRERSAAALRKQVDPGLCASCHDGSVEGAKVLFAK